ncbi:MAG: hypothetical protein ACQEVA_22450 [Myxococcota bacterium]
MAKTSGAKQKTLEMVSQLEDDVSCDEILYRLYMLRKIERGLADVEAGRVHTHDEVREQVEKWLE